MIPATILVSEALHAFLQSHKSPANADLVDKLSIAMETQTNVAAGDGQRRAVKTQSLFSRILRQRRQREPRRLTIISFRGRRTV